MHLLRTGRRWPVRSGGIMPYRSGSVTPQGKIPMNVTTNESPQAIKAKAKQVRDQLIEKIAAISNTVTPEEREIVDKIITRAKVGKRDAMTAKLSPAMSALIFRKANDWNRVWSAPKVLEYARRIHDKAWQWNGQGVSFYNTGNLGDGQHRLCAAALEGFTWETVIVFGVDPEAVSTIDDGSARQASDHAHMHGVEDAGRKQTIIRSASAYFAKVKPDPIKFVSVKSAAELAVAIKDHDPLLSKAIELGEASRVGRAGACLKPNEAARAAFVMLYGGWPPEKVTHDLASIQSGVANETEGGADSPLYVARKIIDMQSKGDTVQAVKQIGWIVNAAIKFEAGDVASAKIIKNEVEKGLPNPKFTPGKAQQAA